MKVADVKRITYVGGGVIGSSWATQFAMRGLTVTLYDINDEQLRRNETRMYKNLGVLEQFNVITPGRRGGIVAATRLATSMEGAVAGTQFIQEGDPKRLEIKQPILAQVETCAVVGTLYAGSTSDLLISDIAAKAVHPERHVGVRPYNPPRLIPLVGLTPGDKTDPALLRLAYDFYQSISKETVPLRRGCPGFVANRFQLALYRGMQGLVMRGVCSVEDADEALVYGPGPYWATFDYNMIIQLDNPGSLTGMVNMLSNSGGRWLVGMTSWTYQSDNWAEVAQPGVNEEMKHFPDHIGRTSEACAVYRNQALIELPKLHRKL